MDEQIIEKRRIYGIRGDQPERTRRSCPIGIERHLLDMSSFGPKSFILGDAHNFGRRVSILGGTNPPRIKKPRTVFWENLFLNSESKFRRSLRSLSTKKCDFDYFLGHIGIVEFSDWHGEVDCIERFDSSIPDLYQLGGISALSLIFGWTDLHRENLVVSRARAQIVDLESVFWNTQLLSETLLIPGAHNSADKSVFYGHFPARLSPEQLIEYLAGYLSGFEAIKLNRSVILDSLNESLNPHTQSAPVRIILRHTREYSNYLQNRALPLLTWLPEEIEQLERGDVPYFWGYLGMGDVWYLKAWGRPLKAKLLPPWVALKTARAFLTTTQLLERERIERIEKQGAIEAVFRMCDFEKLPYTKDNYKIEIYGGRLRLSTGQINLQVAIADG